MYIPFVFAADMQASTLNFLIIKVSFELPNTASKDKGLKLLT
ncbi:hypothetical protein [Nostoc sp. FACHB-145]|nr:hypothetical protein [Nostoc sp. FACHB-145]